MRLDTSDHEGKGGAVHFRVSCDNRDRNDIVNNMHEAYERIANPGYGCFISGPSKTADIAQALVMGAQAARDVLYVIV